jgi:hypothetical protein
LTRFCFDLHYKIVDPSITIANSFVKPKKWIGMFSLQK